MNHRPDEPKDVPQKNQPEVVSLGPSDQDKADDYRRRLEPIIAAAAAIVGEAQRNGIRVAFQVQTDQWGRFVSTPIEAVKVL